MPIIDSLPAITRRVIARDGIEGYTPTLMLPASQDLIVLEGAPEDSTLPAIARRWSATPSPRHSPPVL